MNDQWREFAEENNLDCTLKKVQIECVLEHVAVSGDDFMPAGWCGPDCCDHCRTMPCLDVCEACSYTKTYDLRQPVYWPCHVEKVRLENEYREQWKKTT